MGKRLLLRKAGRLAFILILLSAQMGALAPAPVQAVGYTAVDIPQDAPRSATNSDTTVLPVAQTNPNQVQAVSPEWFTEVIDPGVSRGMYNSAVVAADDTLHISYNSASHSGSSLRYAVGTTSAWITELVDDAGSAGAYNAITLDGSAPLISYYDETNSALKLADKHSASWVSATVDSAGIVGTHTSLAHDAKNGTIHISYADQTNGALKYARWNGSAWALTTVDNRFGAGTYTSLVLKLGSPRVSYRNVDADSLRYAEFQAGTGSWLVSNINSAGVGGAFTSMVMDSKGYERISYSRSGQGVRYILRELGGWYDYEVAADSGTEIPTALALDSANQPHIAYVSGENHLMYAVPNPRGGWTVVTVDDSGSVGTQSLSMVVDSEDRPHIVYHDTAAGLKHAWFDPLPDLYVTDIWPKDGSIWAQVRNIGKAGTAGGHIVSLSIDAAGAFTQTISVELLPGERSTVELAPWLCSGISDTIRVIADRGSDIAEVYEDNNEREEIWKCDTTPPLITTRPAASNIQTDTVTITWVTDKASDSRVSYGSMTGVYSWEQTDPANVTDHQVTLSGLRPATIYRYMVDSTDSNGNRVSSREGFFETAASPVEEPTGQLEVVRRPGDYDIYEFSFVLDDLGPAAQYTAESIASVTFKLDGTKIGRRTVARSEPDQPAKYTLSVSPAQLGYTRNKWAESGGRNLQAEIELLTGVILYSGFWFYPPTEARPLELTLMTPWEGADYSADDTGVMPPGSKIQIFAEAIEYDWACEWVTFRNMDPTEMPPDCHDVARQVGRVDYYIDNVLIHTMLNPTEEYVYKYEYYPSGLAVGTHTVKVVATASDDPSNQLVVERQFNVVAGSHNLSLERTVTRMGSHFEVSLELSLAASASTSVAVDYIEDYVREFMPASNATDWYAYSVERYPVWLGSSGERTARVMIDLTGTEGFKRLFPGDSFTVTYYVIPILYENGIADPAIGHLDTVIHYTHSGVALTADFRRLWQSASSFQSALAQSDYVIVTNPTRLKSMNNQYDVYSLYGLMAILGVARNGVLGMLETYDTEVLDLLLEPDGYFSESLNPVFQASGNNAYVLIVGETEIVPAFNSYNYDICWSIPGDDWHCSGTPNDVYHHDQWYASTSAPGGTPELNLGRIIGNTAALLKKPIENSLSVLFGSMSYQAPGNAIMFAQPSEDWFISTANDVACSLSNLGWAATSLTLPETNPSTSLADVIDDGWSLIHLFGHGSVGTWGNSALNEASPVSFGGYSPFVFAPTCHTGNYEGNVDVSLAERMLQWGAGVYIGATQVSSIQDNHELGKAFYSYWQPGSGEPIGRAFAQLERAKYSPPTITEWFDWRRFWVVEYNLYGDPKFGVSGPSGMVAALPAAEPLALPEPTLHVQVPAYVITTTAEGLDQVTIPEGHIAYDIGAPQVPYWSVSLQYPAGYRVRDVVLAGRSGYTYTTGLNLPVTRMEPASGIEASQIEPRPLPVIEDDSWFPELDKIFQWDVTENPDGSSELHIVLVPFHYQPETTNVEWYDTFDFEIDVIESGVSISRLTLDKGSYDPGETVLADLWLDNIGDAKDVIVIPSVRLTTADHTVLGAVTMSVLHDTESLSHSVIEWDSTGYDPGEYMLLVEIMDGEGTLLVSANRLFQLGAASAQITQLAATPDRFRPGDAISLSMTILNTGPVDISGEAHIMVQTADGVTDVAVYTQTVTSLAPGANLSMDRVWDTTGETGASYRVVAYMTFGGTATEIATVFISGPHYLYLPLTLK